MSSRIALAANGFLRRLPPPQRAEEYWTFPGERLSGYLTQEVVPAVDELLRSPGFRTLAAASLDVLTPGGQSRATSLIEALKEGIRATVDEISTFVELHAALFTEHMDDAVRRWRRIRFPTVGALEVRQPDATDTAERGSRALEAFCDRLRGVRARCEDEWVSPDDYFGPLLGIGCEVNGEWIQFAEFNIAFSDELDYVGNYIAHCILVRSKTAVGILRELTDELNVTFVAARRQMAYPWTARQQRLEELLAELRNELLHTESAALTEAAMTLVQVHAEFSGASQRYDWLPIADWVVQRRRGSLRRALESKRDCETAEKIGLALKLIRDWFDRRPAAETELEAAIASGGLVIEEGRRRVHWESRLIEANWSSRQQAWNLLRRLALNRGRVFLSEHDFYNDDKDRSPSAYAGVKRTLSLMLPASLRQHIEAASDRCGYRLSLEPAKVHFFSAGRSA